MLASLGGFLDMQHFSPPGLLHQTLSFKKIAREFTCILMFEKHCSCRLPPTSSSSIHCLHLKALFISPHLVFINICGFSASGLRTKVNTYSNTRMLLLLSRFSRV